MSNNHALRMLKACIAVGTLVLASAFAHAVPIYIGNSLTVPNGGADGTPPLVILGEYNPAGPLAASPIAFPSAGTVTDVQFYGGDYNFTVYALSLVGSGNNEQTFQVAAAESFSGSSPVGIQILPTSNFSVGAGDLLAFAGVGPFYPQNGNDASQSDATYEDASNPNSFTATPPGGVGSVFAVGINPDPNANYEYIPDVFGNQGRIYGFGVDFQPASPISEPSSLVLLSGGVLALAGRLRGRVKV